MRQQTHRKLRRSPQACRLHGSYARDDDAWAASRLVATAVAAAPHSLLPLAPEELKLFAACS